ncbi:MAG TPA: sensor histidine kinase [Streptosporangiaceae bacterium]|nr:sensor histidine kinase [Streptosporangiaceae bacterium]
MSTESPWRRYWRDATLRDAGLAVIMTAITLFGAYGEAHPGHHYHVPKEPNVALLLVAAASLVLAVRRRYPLTVLAVSTSAVVVYTLFGYENGAALLAPTLALYTVAIVTTIRQATIAGGATLVALMASGAAANPFGPTGGGYFLIPALVAAAFFGGIAVRNHRAFVASIQARAEEDASRRVGEERLRIARELHDVVAHTMSTINVQATAAAQVLTERPQTAAEALAAIRVASKDGLRELRAILHVLRQADDADPTAPTPSLTELDALIASANQAGLPTELEVSGETTNLSPTADLAAYRIVQESLTNAIRHAGPAKATVRLTYSESELLIAVADTGRGAQAHDAAGVGYGLIGMRERAAAAGGTMRAGTAPGGGYLVTARLPVTGEQS